MSKHYPPEFKADMVAMALKVRCPSAGLPTTSGPQRPRDQSREGRQRRNDRVGCELCDLGVVRLHGADLGLAEPSGPQGPRDAVVALDVSPDGWTAVTGSAIE